MSNQRKRIGLIVISIILISFSAGWIIRGFSEGGTPTIDPIEGLSDFSWFNASIGIRAPEFWHEDLGNYTAWVLSIESGGGVTDHGALTGLGDDDHSLYLLQSGVEGLTGDWDVGNYDLSAKYMNADEFYRAGLGNYTAWIESISGGGVTDHGALTGLTDDDHPQYLEVGEGGETDHGALTGLTDDDHPQYLEVGEGGATDHGDLTGLNDDDHSAYVDKDGTEGLTGDWDVGEYNLTAKDITADEFYLTGLGNYTEWVESILIGSSNQSSLAATFIIGQDATKQSIPNYVYCDGTADDVQINAAFALPGVRVQLEAATIYDIDNPIEMDEEYQELVGMGKSTILRADNNLEDNIIEMTGYKSWFQVVRDLQTEGNKENNANGHSIWISQTYGTTDSHVTLTDLWIRNSAQDGVHIVDGTGTREPHFTRVIVSFADGVSFRIGGTDSKLEHCISENPQGHGFQVYSNGQWTHCKSFGAGKGGTGHGWYFSGQRAGAVMLSNCIGEDSANAGFLVWNANNIHFTGCEANSNQQEGFYFNADSSLTYNCSIVGGASWSRGGGLYTQTYGIRYSSNAQYNSAVGVFVEEGSTDGIGDAGTGNEIHLCFDGNDGWIP